MKVKPRRLTKKEKMETLDALYTAMSAIKGRDAVKLFLRDLLTESERIMLGRRILIARELLSGACYEDISHSMKVGHDTIWRVQRWLSDQMPGYEQAIDEMNKEMDRREEKRRLGRMYADQTWKGTLARLKKKYPLHFLLFPWPEEYRPLQNSKRGKRLPARKGKRSKRS